MEIDEINSDGENTTAVGTQRGTGCLVGRKELQATASWWKLKSEMLQLLPIIQHHIRPGSVIYSDEWRAYCRLGGMGYTHKTVNHSQNFVDPITGAHTQQVESMWSSCKRMMRETKTMHSTLFETYLPEYMWRKNFDGIHRDAFQSIIGHIAEQYPQ